MVYSSTCFPNNLPQLLRLITNKYFVIFLSHNNFESLVRKIYGKIVISLVPGKNESETKV